MNVVASVLLTTTVSDLEAWITLRLVHWFAF